MKKFSLIVLIVLLAGSTICGSAYGASDYPEQTEINDVSLRYEGIVAITPVFSIDSSGNSRNYLKINAQSSSSVDYAIVTVKIESKSGSVVKSWTNVKLTMENNQLKFDETFKISSKGSYRMTYAIKCYKNGAVIDTATGSTSYKTF